MVKMGWFLVFARRIKKLRQEKDLLQKDIANYLGISTSAYGFYEQEKRQPDPDTLQKLAKFFHCSIDYLLGLTDNKLPHKNKIDILNVMEDNGLQLTAGDSPLTQDQRVGILRALDNPNAFKKDTIPILGKVPAGIPVMANNEWDGELDIPSDIEADFALQVKGDSMIGAGIHEGDYAICREAYGASSGNIVVALEDIGPEYSRGTLKYYIQENSHEVLRAANPEYEDIPLGDNHRITGVMIGLIRIGPTPLGYFKDYISIRDYHLKEWNAVIEEAVAGGIEPGFVKTLIQNQISLASQLARRKSP